MLYAPATAPPTMVVVTSDGPQAAFEASTASSRWTPTAPPSPTLDGPYTVLKIEGTADDWWNVLDGSGEKIALTGEPEARMIAAALNRAALLDAP